MELAPATTAQIELKRLNLFERYLSVWVGLCMVAGVLLGKALPGLVATAAVHLITMGCGVEADMCPAGAYIAEDWDLEDPHGQPLGKVREIRNQIRERVERLLTEMDGSL